MDLGDLIVRLKFDLGDALAKGDSWIDVMEGMKPAAENTAAAIEQMGRTVDSASAPIQSIVSASEEGRGALGNLASAAEQAASPIEQLASAQETGKSAISALATAADSAVGSIQSIASAQQEGKGAAESWSETLDKAVGTEFNNSIETGLENVKSLGQGMVAAGEQASTASTHVEKIRDAVNEYYDAARKAEGVPLIAADAADRLRELKESLDFSIKSYQDLEDEITKTREAGLGVDADKLAQLTELRDEVERAKKQYEDFTGEVVKFGEKPLIPPQSEKDLEIVREAFNTLGIQSSETLNNLAMRSEQAFEIIKTSGTASAVDIQKAWVAMEEARQKAAAASGDFISQAERNALKDAKEQIAELEQGFSHLAEHITEAAAVLSSAGKALSVAITVPLTALSAILIKVGDSFDEASDTIRAKTGLVGADLEAMNASFNNVAKTVPNSLKDITTAFVTLEARLGMTGSALEHLSTQMLNLSRITGTSIGTIADTGSQVFARWKISTEEQSAALDKLYYASTKTGTGVGQMLAQLRQFQPVFQELRFGFDESVALLARFDQAGLNTQRDLMSLQRAIMTMGRAGLKDPAEGLQLLIDRIKAAGSAGEANAIGVKLFGRGAVDLTDAIRSGKLNLDDFVKSLATSGGAINKAAADTLSFSDKLKLLRNQFEVELRPAAEAFLKVLEAFMAETGQIMSGVGSLSKAFAGLSSETQQALVAFAAVAGGTGPALLALGGLSSGIAKLITTLREGGMAWTVFVGLLRTAEIAAVTLSIYSLIKAIDDLGAANQDAQKSEDQLQAQLAATDVALKQRFAAYPDYLAKLADLRNAYNQGVTGPTEYARAMRDLSQEFLKQHPLAVSATADVINLTNEIKKGVSERQKELEVAQQTLASMKASGAGAAEIAAAQERVNQAQARVTQSTAAANAALDKLLSTHKSSVLSLSELIAKQQEWASQIRTAQEVLDRARAAEDGSARSKMLVTEALKQLIKVQKQASDQEANAGLIATETILKTNQQISKAYALIDATNALIKSRGEEDAATQQLIASRDAALKQMNITLEQFGLLGQGAIALGNAFKDLGVTSSSAMSQMASDAQASLSTIQLAFQSGAASLGDLFAAQDKFRQEQRNFQDSLSGTAQAFKNLHVTSTEEMRRAAEDAEVNFTRISQSGTRSHGDIIRAMEAVQNANRQYIDSLSGIPEAFKQLGVTSTEVFRRQAEDARTAYERIRDSGTESAGAVQRAWMAAEEAQAKYLESLHPIDLAAQEIEDAFKQLGITSSESLRQSAAAAEQAYNVILRSGTATAGDISRAWNALMGANQAYITSLRSTETEFSTLGTKASAAFSEMTRGAQMAAASISSMFGLLGKGPTLTAGPFDMFDPQHPEQGGYTLSTSGPGLPYGGGTGYRLTYHEPFTPENTPVESPKTASAPASSPTLNLPTGIDPTLLAAASAQATKAINEIDFNTANLLTVARNIQSILTTIAITHGSTTDSQKMVESTTKTADEGQQSAGTLLDLLSETQSQTLDGNQNSRLLNAAIKTYGDGVTKVSSVGFQTVSGSVDGLKARVHQSGVENTGQIIAELVAHGMSLQDALSAVQGQVSASGDVLDADTLRGFQSTGVALSDANNSLVDLFNGAQSQLSVSGDILTGTGVVGENTDQISSNTKAIITVAQQILEALKLGATFGGGGGGSAPGSTEGIPQAAGAASPDYEELLRQLFEGGNMGGFYKPSSAWDRNMQDYIDAIREEIRQGYIQQYGAEPSQSDLDYAVNDYIQKQRAATNATAQITPAMGTFSGSLDTLSKAVTSAAASVSGTISAVTGFGGLDGVASTAKDTIASLNALAEAGRITADEFVRRAQALGYAVTETVAAPIEAFGAGPDAVAKATTGNLYPQWPGPAVLFSDWTKAPLLPDTWTPDSQRVVNPPAYPGSSMGGPASYPAPPPPASGTGSPGGGNTFQFYYPNLRSQQEADYLVNQLRTAGLR